MKQIFKPENYVKFIQFIFIASLLFIFIASFIYFWMNDVDVNNMTVIFTVIVGWLGLIIGAFFGEKSMDNLTNIKREFGVKRTLFPLINKYESLINRYKNQINDLLEIIKDYEEKTRKS